MRKVLTLAFCAVVLLGGKAWGDPVPGVVVNGGELDVEYFVGTGANTSYFVVDFFGSPVTNPGPHETHAFGYRWDGPATTADALLAIDVAGGLEMGTTDHGGSLGLAINRFAFGSDDDTPDFSIDNRYWNFFQGTHINEVVIWASSNIGISGRSLVDGSFDGFVAQQFSDTDEPRTPVVAVPEPGGGVFLMLMMTAVAGRRRWLSA